MQQFLKYPAIFLAGFATTYLLTPILIKFAKKVHLVDIPDQRRIHNQPIPNIGGLAIFTGFQVVCAIIFTVPWDPFTGILNSNWWHNYLTVSTLLLLLGIVDDMLDIGPLVKLCGQLCIAFLAFSYNIRVEKFLGFELPWFLDLIVTVVWILVLVNAFNLIDGMDGLAVGLAVISSCGIAGSLLFRHLPGDALILMGLIGVCLAFLKYNYYPARIFLGDSGSMFLGFTLATIALGTTSKGTAMATIGIPLLAVGVPIFDTILAIWRRSVRGIVKISNNRITEERLMKPDLDHLHHRLLNSGLPQQKVAGVLYVINGSLVIIGLLSLFYRSHAIGMYLISFVVGSYLIVKHLARIELWDSGFAILEGLHHPPDKTKAVLIYPILDCFLLALATAISLFLVHMQGQEVRWEEIKNVWFDSLPIHISIPFLCLAMTKTYSRVWSRARISEFVILTLTILAGILTVCGFSILINDSHMHSKIILECVIYAGISIPLLTGCRAFLRTVEDFMFMDKQHRRRATSQQDSKILIYGAGHKGALFLRQKGCLNSKEGKARSVIGFLDDDLNLRKRLVHGYKILGDVNEVDLIIDEFHIDEIVITANLRKDTKLKLLSIARIKNIKVSSWVTDEEVLYEKVTNAIPPEIESSTTAIDAAKN